MTRLATVLILLPLLAAADWPQWRGPNRDGHAPDFKLPTTWPAKAPAPRWKVPAGDGYAGVCVAAGKAFVHDRVDGKERVRALDAATGKELWSIDYPEAFTPPDPTAGKGPGATPAFDRDRVYTFGLGGVLLALDATGKELWKHDCKAEFWGVKKGPLGDDVYFPPCGACASPLVDGDTVVVNVGGPKGGTFAAFDRDSGKVVWKALDDRSSYASPVIASPGGVKQLICFTGTRMVGVKYDDKSLLWGVPFKALYDQTIISPVVWKDRVVIAGEGRPTFAVTVPPKAGSTTPDTAWKNDDLKSYLTTPVVVGDHLIGVDMRTSRLVCVGLADGETAWASPRIAGKYHSLAVAGGTGFCLTSEGELVIFRAAADEWAELARWTVAGKGSWAHLALADRRLYVKDQAFVYCYDLPA